MTIYYDDASYVYALDAVAFDVQSLTFVVAKNVEDHKKIEGQTLPLLYTTKAGSVDVSKVAVRDETAGFDWKVASVCGGQWVVATLSGDASKFKCFDPTVGNYDPNLKTGFEITFFIIVGLADTTLLILAIVFGTLNLLPFIKKRMGKSSDGYGSIGSD